MRDVRKAKKLTHNVALLTDSYKTSHYKQYPPNTTNVFSFFESRGGQEPEVTFFGLQYLIKKYLLGNQAEFSDILAAQRLIDAHMGEGTFNFRRNKQATLESMARDKIVTPGFNNLEAAQHFELIEDLAVNCPHPHFRIDYEDLFLFKRLEELFEFCGLEYSKAACEALFDIPHSNNHKPGRFKNE